jgi:hypothetical protein
MDLDALVTQADPARRAVLDGPDSADGTRLYRRITGPSRGGRASRLLGRRLLGRRLTVSAAGAAVAGLAVAVTMALLPGSPIAALPAAVAVLDQAAATAASQPAGPVLGPGQYLYVKSLETVGVPNLEESMDGGPVIVGAPLTMSQPQSGGPVTYEGVNHICTMLRELWFAPDGSGRMVWTPAGRQSTSAAQGCHAYAQTMPANNAHMNPYFPLGGARLPTDPAALERAVEQRYADGKPDFTMFIAVSELLEASQSPAVRAALYGVIERLPGIMNLGPMTDRLGRHGIAVGFMDSGTRYGLIFDPATSAVLEATGVVVTSKRQCNPATTDRIPASTVHGPHGVTHHAAVVLRWPRFCIPAQAAGTAGYAAYVTSGVVNSDTATPPAVSSAPIRPANSG